MTGKKSSTVLLSTSNTKVGVHGGTNTNFWLNITVYHSRLTSFGTEAIREFFKRYDIYTSDLIERDEELQNDDGASLIAMGSC